MIDSKIENALNQQLNQEQTASQEYLAMAGFFERTNLGGFAAFMRSQAAEERTHALKFFDYLVNRGGTVRLGAIREPKFDFDSPKTAFEAAYSYEQGNTKSIHELYAMASKAADYATQTMLHWFIDEQVEEEKWCEDAIALLETAGDNRSALLMLDKRYGELAATERT